jgi:hypothetical protein
MIFYDIRSINTLIKSPLAFDFMVIMIISCKYRHSSVEKCHTLSIDMKKSKALRTHLIHVYAKTNFPQQKKSIAHFMVE